MTEEKHTISFASLFSKSATLLLNNRPMMAPHNAITIDMILANCPNAIDCVEFDTSDAPLCPCGPLGISPGTAKKATLAFKSTVALKGKKEVWEVRISAGTCRLKRHVLRYIYVDNLNLPITVELLYKRNEVDLTNDLIDIQPVESVRPFQRHMKEKQ